MKIKSYELNGGYYISVVFGMSIGEDITVSFQDAELSTLDKRLVAISEYSGATERYPDLTELRSLAKKCFSPDFKERLVIDKTPKQKTEKVMKPYERIEVIDGVAVADIGAEEVDGLVWDYLPMVDKDGNAVMELVSEAIKAKPAVKDKDNKIIEKAVKAKEAVYRQRTYRVPVME